jgi:hypothetical protein
MYGMGIGQLGAWRDSLGSSRIRCVGPGWPWIVIEGGRYRCCPGGGSVGHRRFSVWVRCCAIRPSWGSVAP